MRGFGVTGLDFSIEVQMDKLAHLVGIDPMEFRILNAYRDGDMKAHRRLAHNTALIECVQVAAQKVNWPLSETARRASSLSGGGPRAAIPPTVTDESGRIGRPETRQAPPQLAPGAAPLPAYQAPPAVPVHQSPPAHQPVAPLPNYPSQPAAAAPLPPVPTPPVPNPPAAPQHGAARFSSVFTRRR
jgi:hypothetical protein